jgi:hypothetical protein
MTPEIVGKAYHLEFFVGFACDPEILMVDF